MTSGEPDREIVNTRLYPYAPARVFEAFADSAKLARWWGPKGFTNTFYTFHFASGGTWLFTMHGPDGSDYKNECLFREISGPSRLIIDHISAPKFELEIAMDEAAGGTLLTWVQRFETAEMRNNILKRVGAANEEVLDRLADVLANT